jgi:hypothetical protein
MKDKVVLVLSGVGANNAIQGMMTEFGNALSAHGLPIVTSPPDGSIFPPRR